MLNRIEAVLAILFVSTIATFFIEILLAKALSNIKEQQIKKIYFLINGFYK
jgi:uncharacterized membrane protein